MVPNFEFFSPETAVSHPLYTEKKVNVYFKRDDLIHPYISGNKWRKLKYNLAKAVDQNKTKLVTFGGAWSNHLLATACAAALFGFKSEAFVRGEEVENPVLAMARLFGMQLNFVSRDKYKNKEHLYNTLEDKELSYFIDEGGYGTEATKGCIEIIDELIRPYDHIVCPAGTGTTVAGLAQGLLKHNLSTTLHVIPVLKGGEFIEEEMRKLDSPTEHTVLHTSYHFGGYAKSKPALTNFIKDFVSSTGILIEPTYSGKAVYALHDLIQQDLFKPQDNILYIHTGGLTGLLGMLNKF